MGTDETCMAWILDEIGRAVGLPRVLGGIPLDELGATGFGLANCAEVACGFAGIELKGARVAIEGFGSVGRNAARFLEERGAVMVAVSDSKGAIHNPGGLPTAEVAAAKCASGSVTGYKAATEITHEGLFTVPCEILIPAARPDSIHDRNVPKIQAKLILPGANIPITSAGEEMLHKRGVVIVPDFIANAGGVICAAAEYHGRSQSAAFDEIADRIKFNTDQVLSRSRDQGLPPRKVAVDLATERVREAAKLRRHF
jgi:glutamate dehydrogenase/leucine dehydrogenase